MQNIARNIAKSLSLKRTFAGALAVILCIMLVGCGSKVDGKYSAANGMMTLELKGGKATISGVGGGAETCDYTVEGDKVILKEKDVKNGPPAKLTITKDGSLEGNGISFKKAD